jgi:hypothetical protein
VREYDLGNGKGSESEETTKRDNPTSNQNPMGKHYRLTVRRNSLERSAHEGTRRAFFIHEEKSKMKIKENITIK